MTASPMARALIFAIVCLSAAVGSWWGPQLHGVEHRAWFAFDAWFVTFALAEQAGTPLARGLAPGRAPAVAAG